MWDKLEAQFTDILRPLFPHEAEFRRIKPYDDLRFSVKWKLKNDPDRPSKRSRPIILNVSQDKLEEENCSDHMSDALERDIKNSVVERLKTFNPNHDAPMGQEPEPEKWEL